MAVRTRKKAVHMAGFPLFFFLGGRDPLKEKSGLATRDYTRRLYEISLLEKPIITFIHNIDTIYIFYNATRNNDCCG